MRTVLVRVQPPQPTLPVSGLIENEETRLGPRLGNRLNGDRSAHSFKLASFGAIRSELRNETAIVVTNEIREFHPESRTVALSGDRYSQRSSRLKDLFPDHGDNLASRWIRDCCFVLLALIGG